MPHPDRLAQSRMPLDSFKRTINLRSLVLRKREALTPIFLKRLSRMSERRNDDTRSHRYSREAVRRIDVASEREELVNHVAQTIREVRSLPHLSVSQCDTLLRSFSGRSKERRPGAGGSRFGDLPTAPSADQEHPPGTRPSVHG
jgi:hypothetical protein